MNKKNYRKLDNIAKLFSLDDKKNKNIFRYSVLLKEKINPNILKKALEKSLECYKSFKVKLGKGMFWNHLETNNKNIIINYENKENMSIDNNNDYLFKISYYKKKINLDIFHVLTDGVGAINFLKSIIYNYLNIKYNLSYYNNNEVINSKDEFINKYNPNYKEKFNLKKAYLLPQKTDYYNTTQYILNVKEVKKVCNNYNVTITEYFTALYIYSMYLSLYNKKTKKEIVVTIPINLRGYFKVNPITNFFSAMNINPEIFKKRLENFEDILHEVCNEFKNKLNNTKIKQYISRDVNIGKNITIKLIPLNIKKFAMKYFGKIINSHATTTLSNVGKIDIDDNYKEYIDNIFLLSKPWKVQKIKCSICSYENNLNITFNSCINDVYFQNIFYNFLKKDCKNIKIISDIT